MGKDVYMPNVEYSLEQNSFRGAQRLVRPSCGWVRIDLAAVWRYRELLYFLTWRDINVRYKQTLLGVCWILLQPLLIMAVFSTFFGLLIKVPSDGIPYPVFAFCGLVPWQLFASGFTDAANSLLVNQNLITKVHFPRLVIPLSAVLARLVDFTCAFVVLLGLIYYYQIVPGHTVWALPLLTLLVLTNSAGVGLWLSALGVRYRDARHMIPFITQVWFFLSPIAYPASVVPQEWRFLYALNPMVGIIEGFRWALLGKGNVAGLTLAVSAATVVLVLIGGLCYFRRVERTIADIL
jgi:lipopolysaccharide transport system permease protein